MHGLTKIMHGRTKIIQDRTFIILYTYTNTNYKVLIRLRSFHIADSHSIYCVLVIAQQSEFPLFNSFKRGVKMLRTDF